MVEVDEHATTCRSTAAPATSSASTARSSRRSSSCAAPTTASPSSCARSPIPARSPTRSATRPTCPSRTRSARSRRSTSPTACEIVVELQRERLTELQLRKKIREDVQSGADKQQREYILRKQMESIQRELGEDGASVAEEYRKKIADAGMPEAVEEQADEGARAPGAHGRAVRRGLDDPHLPRLADRGAVEQDLRREARPERRARGARRRPRGPRGRQGPHHRVPGGQEAARPSAASRRTSAPAPSSP